VRPSSQSYRRVHDAAAYTLRRHVAELAGGLVGADLVMAVI